MLDSDGFHHSREVLNPSMPGQLVCNQKTDKEAKPPLSFPSSCYGSILPSESAKSGHISVIIQATSTEFSWAYGALWTERKHQHVNMLTVATQTVTSQGWPQSTAINMEKSLSITEPAQLWQYQPLPPIGKWVNNLYFVFKLTDIVKSMEPKCWESLHTCMSTSQ